MFSVPPYERKAIVTQDCVFRLSQDAHSQHISYLERQRSGSFSQWEH